MLAHQSIVKLATSSLPLGVWRHLQPADQRAGKLGFGFKKAREVFEALIDRQPVSALQASVANSDGPVFAPYANFSWP